MFLFVLGTWLRAVFGEGLLGGLEAVEGRDAEDGVRQHEKLGSGDTMGQCSGVMKLRTSVSDNSLPASPPFSLPLHSSLAVALAAEGVTWGLPASTVLLASSSSVHGLLFPHGTSAGSRQTSQA